MAGGPRAPAFRRHAGDQAGAVRQPGKARARSGVDPRIRQPPRLARGGVGDPQLQPVRLPHQEGDMIPRRRPGRRRQPRAPRQGDATRLTAGDGLEAEAGQPADAAVGRAVVARIDAVAGQLQHRLGQLRYRRQVRPIEQRQPFAVGTEAGRRRGIGVENGVDRRRRVLIGRRRLGGRVLRQRRPSHRQSRRQDQRRRRHAHRSSVHPRPHLSPPGRVAGFAIYRPPIPRRPAR